MESEDRPTDIFAILDSITSRVVSPEDALNRLLKDLDESLHPLAHAIVKSNDVGKEFTGSLGSVGSLLAKPGVTVEMLRPIALLAFDNAIERLLAIRASLME